MQELSNTGAIRLHSKTWWRWMRSSFEASEERDRHFKNHYISKSRNVFHSLLQMWRAKENPQKLKWVDSSTSLFLAAVADFYTRRRHWQHQKQQGASFLLPPHSSPSREMNGDAFHGQLWEVRPPEQYPQPSGLKRALSFSLVSPLKTAGGGWAPYTKTSSSR